MFLQLNLHTIIHLKCKFWCLINLHTIRLEDFPKKCAHALSFFIFIVCMWERERHGQGRDKDMVVGGETGRQREWVNPHHGTYVKIRGQLLGVLSVYHGGPGFELRVSGLLPSTFTHRVLSLTQKCSNSPSNNPTPCPSGTYIQALICSQPAIKLLQSSYFCLKKLF